MVVDHKLLTSSPIFFNNDIPVITPGTTFRERSLQKFRLLQVSHYIEIIQFFLANDCVGRLIINHIRVNP